MTAIGAGGMGEVYRARDPRLSRDVAVKVMSAELAKDPEWLRRFEQEARSTASLSHPNILAVHDVGKSGELSYIVTELLSGEILREQLVRGALPVRKALEAYNARRCDLACHEWVLPNACLPSYPLGRIVGNPETERACLHFGPPLFR